MHLKVKRSQREGGMFGGKHFFMLDLVTDFTQEERDLINKYKLGSEIIFASPSKQITIASLAKGEHVECKDLGELTKMEADLLQICRNVKSYIEVAKSFDGREVLIDFSGPEPVAT